MLARVFLKIDTNRRASLASVSRDARCARERREETRAREMRGDARERRPRATRSDAKRGDEWVIGAIVWASFPQRRARETTTPIGLARAHASFSPGNRAKTKE